MAKIRAKSTARVGRPRDSARRQQRRLEILTVAASVFARHGFAGTDVQVIADQLGVGKGTIYRHFRTKKALFLATVEAGLKDLNQRIDAILDEPAGPPLEIMSAAIRQYLLFFHERPEMVELFIQERAEFGGRHTPLYFARKPDKDQNCRDTAFIDSLIASGQYRPISAEKILIVVGDLLYGTVLSNHLSGRNADPEQQAEAILDIVLNGLLSDSERKRQTKAKENK